jgi:hypothetical protein
VDGEVLDGGLGALLGLHGEEMDPGVGVPDADGAVIGPAEEVRGVVDGGVGVVEVEAGDRAFVLVERAHVLLRGEVEDADGVVRAPGGHHGAAGGDALDGADVRRVRELPLELLPLGLDVVAPQKPLVRPRHQLHAAPPRSPLHPNRACTALAPSNLRSAVTDQRSCALSPGFCLNPKPYPPTKSLFFSLLTLRALHTTADLQQTTLFVPLSMKQINLHKKIYL